MDRLGGSWIDRERGARAGSRRTPSVWRASLLVAGSCLFLFAALLTSTARATTVTGYGELTRFAGATGVGALIAPARVLGVDPTDNSVYVLDEPEPEEPGESLTPEVVRHFRLQKFSETGTLLASATFTDTAPGEPSEERAIEGIAVDPALKRVYLLAVDLRKESLTHDANAPVASTLYAFSTVPSAGTLTGAGKEGEHKEVLAGPTALGAQSDTKGKALLEPAGITVDPATGNIIILAHEDHQGAATDTVENTEDHYVLQAVKSNGALAERYVDATNFLKTPVTGVSYRPDSPIVLGPKASERVVVNYDGLVQMPANFTSKEAPRALFVEPHGEEVVSGASMPHGGALSASPEGVIFGMAHIENETVSEPESGVVMRSGSTGSEIGWTGGQAAAVSLEHNEEDKCVLAPISGTESPPLVAAGSGGKLFVLSPEFLAQPSTEVTKAVIELGPGGTGCPQASASAIAAEAEGLLEEGELVAAGTSVTFSSHVAQADALAVRWSFGDGSEETVSTDQYQTTTSRPHAFASPGEYTVTETIYSDDLAAPAQVVFSAGAFTTPTLTTTRTVLVSGPPTVATEAASAVTQTSASLKATVNPNSVEVSECHFVYGTTTSYGSSVPCGSLPGSDKNPVEVSAPVTGLSPNTTYHFRIVATNTEGTREGSDQTLTTLPNPPTVVTGSASSVGQTSATLEATVNPEGGKVTECTFEYGTSTSYGASVSCSSLPGIAVSATLGSLSPNTAYHYRIKAKNTGGTSYGSDQTLTTQAVPTPASPAPAQQETPPGQAVLSSQEHKTAPVPDVELVGTSLTASASGVVGVKVSCPAAESTCTGTLTLRTLTAVSAGATGHQSSRRKAILALSSGSFTVAAGHSTTVTLHLSATARKLLARTHMLRARATIVAHDPAGATHTTQTVVTIRAAKTHGRKG